MRIQRRTNTKRKSRPEASNVQEREPVTQLKSWMERISRTAWKIIFLIILQKVGVNLKENIPNKIHIIGSVGSGKTTLARYLSSKHNIPYYELDNVVWKRHKSGEIKRTDEERDQYLNEIFVSDHWIIEGAHTHNWVYKSFQNADLIIFLDTPYLKRIIRIIKRFFLQKVGFEKANYIPTIKIFIKMFKWNARFEKQSKPMILSMLRQEDIKFLILKDNNEIKDYYSSLSIV